MKEFKTIKKRALKLAKMSDDKNVERKIRKTQNKQELAFCLLDANQHKIFAEIFETQDVRNFWPLWTEIDYQRYGIDQETMAKTEEQIDKIICNGKEKGLSLEQIEKENVDMIERMINVHLSQLAARKAIHDKMLAEIREVMTEKLNRMEAELAELEKNYRRLTISVKTNKKK